MFRRDRPRARDAHRGRWPRRLLAFAAIAGVIAVGIAIALVARDDDTAATSPAAEVEGDAALPERTVLGRATIEIGDMAWDLEVTRCNVTDDRITAQGDDGAGTTVVASFDRDRTLGSVTVSGRDAAWAIGPAGGTTIDDPVVEPDRLTGTGDFTRRAFGEAQEGDDRPASDPERPTPGSYEITCS